MERKPVVSSNILEIGYDNQSQTLEVCFIGGSVYQYAKVPIDKFADFLLAESKGRYLNSEIKGKYEYKQVS